VLEGINVPPALQRLQVFQFSPWNSGQAEAQVIEFLKGQKLKQENFQSLAAFILAGLGIFLMASLAEK
jgi:hypothetical protein